MLPRLDSLAFSTKAAMVVMWPEVVSELVSSRATGAGVESFFKVGYLSSTHPQSVFSVLQLGRVHSTNCTQLLFLFVAFFSVDADFFPHPP